MRLVLEVEPDEWDAVVGRPVIDVHVGEIELRSGVLTESAQIAGVDSLGGAVTDILGLERGPAIRLHRSRKEA